MDDLAALLEHIMEIKVSIANSSARLTAIEKAVSGNGQPGLAQKVEDLQASKNWMWGLGTAVTFLAGIAEWLFHRR